MAVVPDINQLAGSLNVLQTLLGGAQTEILDENMRQQLGQLTTRMAQSQGDLMNSYPGAMAGLEQRSEAATQQAQATLAEAEQARQTAAELEQARNAPPPPVEEPLDPTLGQTLRAELLERFGDGARGKKGAASQNLSRSEIYELMRKSGVIK